MHEQFGETETVDQQDTAEPEPHSAALSVDTPAHAVSVQSEAEEMALTSPASPEVREVSAPSSVPSPDGFAQSVISAARSGATVTTVPESAPPALGLSRTAWSRKKLHDEVQDEMQRVHKLESERTECERTAAGNVKAREKAERAYMDGVERGKAVPARALERLKKAQDEARKKEAYSSKRLVEIEAEIATAKARIASLKQARRKKAESTLNTLGVVSALNRADAREKLRPPPRSRKVEKPQVNGSSSDIRQQVSRAASRIAELTGDLREAKAAESALSAVTATSATIVPLSESVQAASESPGEKPHLQAAISRDAVFGRPPTVEVLSLMGQLLPLSQLLYRQWTDLPPSERARFSLPPDVQPPGL
jgi:hypothetical protein